MTAFRLGYLLVILAVGKQCYGFQHSPVVRIVEGRLADWKRPLAKDDAQPSYDSSLDGTNVRVGIIKARWNGDIVDKLAAGVRSSIKELKVGRLEGG